MNRVLVVEDEAHLANGLRFNLEAEGYEVSLLDNGEEALTLLTENSNDFDVIVLDVMLPGKDGFAVMSELRQAGNFIPTLMLTARGHADDILRGFAAGADDYLTKPFDLSILIARIRGLLRRRDWLQRSAAPLETGTTEEYRFGQSDDRVLYIERQELHVDRQIHRLTLMEVNLLRYLIQNEGRAISRKEMLEQVWAVRQTTDTRPIDNFIVRLRRYLEDDATQPKHVLTVRGIGYRFIARP